MDFLTEHLKVFKASAWEAWITPLPSVNTEYSKSLGNGSAYFYNVSWIRFGCYVADRTAEPPATINLNTDYAAIQITYSVAVVAKAGLNIPKVLSIILDTFA